MIERTKPGISDGSRFDPAAYVVSLRPLHASERGGWLAATPALPGCTGDGDPVPAPLNRNPLAAE